MQKTNGLAIASMVVGLVSLFINLFGIVALLAIIFAAVAKCQIRDSAATEAPQKGNGFATTGLVLGIIGVVYAVLVLAGLMTAVI